MDGSELVDDEELSLRGSAGGAGYVSSDPDEWFPNPL